MQPLRQFTAIDSHTAGATTRIVTSGTPRLFGATMLQKMEDFRDNHDHIRRSLMLEPRGNANMAGAFLTEPTDPSADLGVIFTYANGYHTMCGHGAIGVACAAIETGLIPLSEPSTSLVLDTPAGLVSVRVDIRRGKIERASFQNVPCFLVAQHIPVSLPGGAQIRVDVAYGGVPVTIADAECAGVRLTKDALSQIAQIAASIREQVVSQVRVRHPALSEPMVPDIVMFCGPATVAGAHGRDIVVSAPAEVDRSPCGAATCARMVQLHVAGALGFGQEYVQEGILETIFTGKLVGRTAVGEYEAFIPEVSGRAHIIGLNHWLVDSDDPLGGGFAL